VPVRVLQGMGKGMCAGAGLAGGGERHVSRAGGGARFFRQAVAQVMGEVSSPFLSEERWKFPDK